MCTIYLLILLLWIIQIGSREFYSGSLLPVCNPKLPHNTTCYHIKKSIMLKFYQTVYNSRRAKIQTHSRSYYRGTRGHCLVWFYENHRYFPPKRSQPGWFWSVLITSPCLILMSGYGHETTLIQIQIEVNYMLVPSQCIILIWGIFLQNFL